MNNHLSHIQDIFTKDLGAEIPEFDFNNKMYRNKSLWAIGSEWEYKGNMYFLVNYGDWKNASKLTWKSFDPRKQTKSFNRKSQENIAAMQAVQKFEQEKKNNECAEKWGPIFDSADSPNLVHEYLVNKKITSNHSARILNGDTLLIPAYDSKKFVGVQMIFRDSISNNFIKRFSGGIKLRGSFSHIGNVKTADVVYICEGFATAATINEVTDTPVLITFNCENILPAIKEFRLINKYARLIICADNDHSRTNKQTGRPENIGVIKARQAARKLSNCIVKVPQFSTIYPELTDFNDLFQQEPDQLPEQLEYKSGDFVNVLTLGRQGKKFYYFSTETKQVVDLTADQHTKNHFLTMADANYWADLYGFKKDKEGQETNKPDYDLVQEKLLTKQRAVGFFNPKNIRGYGCWFDQKRLVVNLGDSLLIDNQLEENIESKYLYESADPLQIDLDKPLTANESKKILDCFKKLNYKNPSDYYFLVAWIGQAQIFGALDWRFQCWITGSRGSGKTEILRMISKLVFNSEIYQSVTAASIRQHLKSNAVPMIIDEAEPNTHEEKKRMDAVIELIRQCSSRLNTKSLRGTASGTALEYNVNSNFLLSSIQSYLPTMADQSRFFEIEMASNENKNDAEWKKIQSSFHEIMDYSPRLFSRFVKMIPVIRKSIKLSKQLLVDSELIQDKRAADQYAAVLGVLSAFVSDSIIDPGFVVETMRDINYDESEYKNNNSDSEPENCLNAILEAIYNKQDLLTIGRAINEENNKALSAYGINYSRIDSLLFIQTGNSELKKLLKDSNFSNIRALMKRHPNFKRVGVFNINKLSRKGVFLKWEMERDYEI
jgi:putative DNA primase/helicase